MSGTGGYAKLVSFVILVLTVVAVVLELYQWVVTGFVSFEVLAVVVAVAVAAFVIVNRVQRLQAFVKWGRAHSVAFLSGVHPNTDARISSEVQSAKKEVLDKTETRLADYLQKVNDDVKRQVHEILGSVRHTVEPVYVNEELVVVQRGYRYAQINVIVNRKTDVRITGGLEALGGGANDIIFYAFDEANFNKFTRNPPWPTSALDQTPQTTRYDFSIPVFASGKYFLVFDNGFSPFSPKTIRFSARIEYDGITI